MMYRMTPTKVGASSNKCVNGDTDACLTPARGQARACMQPARRHDMMHTHKEHMMIQGFLARLPDRFKMTLHNMVGHPVSEVLGLFGFTELSTAVHDATLP